MAAAEHELKIIQQVKSTVESILRMDRDQLDLDASFESFGIDSIIVMELITKLTTQLGVKITPAQFIELRTVRNLAAHIEMQLKGSDTVRRGGSAPAARQERSDQGKAHGEGLGRHTDFKTGKVIRLEQQALISRSTRPSRNRTSGRHSAAETFRKFVDATYGIQMRVREGAAVEELIARLLAEHRAELGRHYGPPGATDVAADEIAPAKAMVVRTSAAGVAQPAIGAGHQPQAVAIVGMGCRFPDAPDTKAFWHNLLEGRGSIKPIGRSLPAPDKEDLGAGEVLSTHPARWGALIGDVDRFDAGFFGIQPSEAILMDPQERLLHEEVYRALEDAGLSSDSLRGTDTGVFIGYEYAEYEQLLRKSGRGTGPAPLFNSSSPTYYLANRLSHTFDFRGPSEAINANCASSAAAINRAFQSLINGECSLAIVAGVSLNLFGDDYLSAASAGRLSPDGTCGVFDDAANGYTRGEGVGVIVLKRLQEAKSDHSRIYAIIRGCHQNYRGKTKSLADVSRDSISALLKDAYAKAGMSPDEVSYMEVDGYATKWGDSMEFEGIRHSLEAAAVSRTRCALGSLKGNIGNLEPASAVAAVIKVALALTHRKFPPTISKKTLNEFIDIDRSSTALFIADRIVPLEEIRRGPAIPVVAGINSFSDSGSNLHIILEEYVETTAVADHADPPREQLCVVSARDPARLSEYVTQLAEILANADDAARFDDVVYTLQCGRDAFGERLAIIASGGLELLQKLRLFQEAGSRDERVLEREGIYYKSIALRKDEALATLIPADLIAMQLEQSLQTGQWRPVATLWINGAPIPWRKGWAGKRAQAASVPGHPFSKDRYWAYGGGESQAAATGPVGNAARMALLLKEELSLLLNVPVQEIRTDRNYVELGVTSLGMIDLVKKLNRVLAVRLSPSILFNYPDVSKLAAHLADTYPAKVAALAITADVPPARIADRKLLESLLWQEGADHDSYEKVSF